MGNLKIVERTMMQLMGKIDDTDIVETNRAKSLLVIMSKLCGLLKESDTSNLDEFMVSIINEESPQDAVWIAKKKAESGLKKNFLDVLFHEDYDYHKDSIDDIYNSTIAVTLGVIQDFYKQNEKDELVELVRFIAEQKLTHDIEKMKSVMA